MAAWKRRKKPIADPDLCVCGRAREDAAERRLMHCRACSRESSRTYRARHATRLASAGRARRRALRDLRGTSDDERRLEQDRVLVRVWIHRGFIRREPCACGRVAQPTILDRETKRVHWACVRCGSTAASKPALAEKTVAPSTAGARATETLVIDRGTINDLIAALDEEKRATLLLAVNQKRPAGVPAMLWRPTSILWRDVAIAVYRDITSVAITT